MQTHNYQPNAGKMALAVAFFSACAVYGFVDAASSHRAMLIDHLVYLAPGQATVARWVMAGFSLFAVVAALAGLIQALMGDQRLRVGDEAIETPKWAFSSATVTMSYRDIVSVTLTKVRSQRFLTLKTAGRHAIILESRLGQEAFDTIARLIAEGRERAHDARVRGAVSGAATARPSALEQPMTIARPPHPNAPRPFGRRT